MQTPHWMEPNALGVIVRLYIQPKASRSEVIGEYGEGAQMRLKIRIAAPPVDNAANEELLRFLKKLTGLPLARIWIVRGESSRSKDIQLEGVSTSEVTALVQR